MKLIRSIHILPVIKVAFDDLPSATGHPERNQIPAPGYHKRACLISSVPSISLYIRRRRLHVAHTTVAHTTVAHTTVRSCDCSKITLNSSDRLHQAGILPLFSYLKQSPNLRFRLTLPSSECRAKASTQQVRKSRWLDFGWTIRNLHTSLALSRNARSPMSRLTSAQ